jgi:plastocyanin
MAPASITEPLLRVLSRSPIRLLVVCAAGVLIAMTMTITTATMATPADGTSGTSPGLGRIEGVVRLVAPTGAPIASGAYPTRRVSRPTPRSSEISNVVVFVKDGPRAGALSTVHAQMVQQEESFVPRLVAITRGSTVEFPNADPYFHNVFSLSRGATFDLGRFPRGERRSRIFTHAGLVKVYCHLHSHMSASIMVFDHPHFAVPHGDGSFVLADIPAGPYRLSAWHERIGESAKDIVIEAGRTIRIEFALPVDTQ